MDAMPTCSGCHKPLPANAPQGLCPECLLKAGLGTGVDIGPDTQSQPAGGSKGFVPPSPEELGRFFPQMEITRLLGRGGMGAVYQARQKQLDRVVALKILPPGVSQDPAFAERFAREARALAKLTHPHIVTLYEFGQADGLFYFLMEFVDGVSLRQLLQASRISPREALAIVPQICDALQYAHDRGIVHRDIKPENILLNREGQVKITDFGVAKIMQVGDACADASGRGRRGWASVRPPHRGRAGSGHAAVHGAGAGGRVRWRWTTARTFTRWAWCSTRCSPANCRASRSSRLRGRSRLTCGWMRWCCTRWRRSPSRRYQQVSEVKTAVETISTPPAATPEATPAPSASWEAARRRVRAPATALLVLGVLGLALCSLARCQINYRAAQAAPGPWVHALVGACACRR